MGRGLNRLSAIRVARLKAPGYYADGGNLYLRIAPGGSKGWMFRFAIAGRTRDAGLGSYPAVSLVKAREKAERHRRQVAAGDDPIEARRKAREAELLASSKAMTFEQCANGFLAAHETAWTNKKHKYQWRATFATYVYPVMGPLPVRCVDTGLVVSIARSWTPQVQSAIGECSAAKGSSVSLLTTRLRARLG